MIIHVKLLFFWADLHVGTCDYQVKVILPMETSSVLPPMFSTIKLEYVFVIDAAWNKEMIVSMARLYDEIMCRTQNITTDISCNLVKITTNFRSVASCDCDRNTITTNIVNWVAERPLKMVNIISYGYPAQMPCQLFSNAVAYALNYIPEETIKIAFVGYDLDAFQAQHCIIDVKRFETSYSILFTPVRVVSRLSRLNITAVNFVLKSVAASPKVIIGAHIEIPKINLIPTPKDIENIHNVVTATFESAVSLRQILTHLIHSNDYVQLTRKTFNVKSLSGFSIPVELVGGAIMGVLISTFIIMTGIILVTGLETNAATTNEQLRVFYETISRTQAQVELGRVNTFRRRNRLPEQRNANLMFSPESSLLQVRESHSASELSIIQEDDPDTAEILHDFAQLEEEFQLMREDQV